MVRLTRSAPVDEVRAAAGHDLHQWGRFLLFTRNEARYVVEKSWAVLPANKKQRIQERVNSLLAKEGIPQVKDDVIRWRMGIAVRDSIKQAANKPTPSGATPSTVTTADSVTRRDGNWGYDPVRDTYINGNEMR